MKFAAVLFVLAVAVTASLAQQFGVYGFNPYYGAYPGFGFAPFGAYFAPHAAVAAAVPAAPFTGNYVAANRGAVHATPLEGHSQSVRTVNTDPAPGTF